MPTGAPALVGKGYQLISVWALKIKAFSVWSVTELGFGRLGGMTKRVGDAVAERGTEFSQLGPPPRQEQTLLAPELPPHGGKGVDEGRPRFAIPSIRTSGGADTKACRKQGHDPEQCQQAGRGAGDRPIGPLALGLDAEMVTHLAERDLHLPALDKPADDLQRLAGGIGAQQCLRVEAVQGIAQQHPTDGQDR
ncbi:MAG: hypothetical protein K0R61_5645 [Microvirga sp.]|nr:hypothetical protein [Microvirga sp.]